MRRHSQASAGHGGKSEGVEPPVRFPIVALGASAGGLAALSELFSHLPDTLGMAFVVIQHLDPARPSMLTDVLAGVTTLDVVEAADNMRLEPNRVHVMPSSSDLTTHDGILSLVPREKTGGLHLPIDSFMRSLAQDVGDHAIGVILSGSGADGAIGVQMIKAEGGVAMAQEPESAQFSSMPEHAIDVGVDFRGDPEAIAEELGRLSRHPYLVAETPVLAPELADVDAGRDKHLGHIFSVLREQAGVDFRGYKPNTLLRRIARRMAVRRVGSLGEYASRLGDDPGEAHALAQDMLINVTSFFRDPAAFAALQKHVFAALGQRKDAGECIRIWVPGCATGEEAYALVMCLLESVDLADKRLTVKLFGTDLSQEAIETARRGIYPDAALTDVSPERLSRFFDRTEGGHRINRLVRDICVFVRHDLTRDPPFAKLDLISCRNVLIYFGVELQRRVLPMLHYCLQPDGHLFLGQSETITGFRDLFAPVSKEHRIFVKTGEGHALLYPLRTRRDTEVMLADSRRPTDHHQRAREAQRQADHLLLARYSPPGVIVNERVEILQFRGRTGDYLEPAPGQPQANLLRMVRADLVAHVHEAIEQAKAANVTIRKEGLRIRVGSDDRSLSVEVVPLTAAADSGERYYLILFASASPGSDVASRPVSGSIAPAATEQQTEETERLGAELTATKDYLQSLIAENQATTDELAAANEELVAGNEELQSTNEELQSAKEELQSTNEELSTVNDQLHHRNAELDDIANDLINVLASVEIPIIIVDLDLRIRRFTPAVSRIASFIPEDVGRSINHLKLQVRVDDLVGKVQEVLTGLSPKEWEVQGPSDEWFRLQIRPYHTVDHRLDGAVLSFVDVNALKRAISDAEGARDYAQSIVETVNAALVVVDSQLRVQSANETFYQTFAMSSATKGMSLGELRGELWTLPRLQDALNTAFTTRQPFSDLECQVDVPSLGPRTLSLNGRPILWGGGALLVLLAIEDVTALRSLEAERIMLLESEKQARIEAERATHAKDLFLATLSHELRTPLSTMLMSAQLLKEIAADNPRIARPSAAIERAAISQAKLIDELLDVSRIVAGKLMLDLEPVDFAALVRETVDAATAAARSKSLTLEVSIDDAVGAVYGDAVRLQQVVNNLLTNAVKFTPHHGKISVSLERLDDQAQLTIADTGMGISAQVLPRLFDRFVQADSTVTRTYGGLGLGLSIVRHLVDAHGGHVHAESAGRGLGASFVVTLPVGPGDAASSRWPQTSSPPQVKDIRILLVEDDDDTREAYAAMLLELGADVRAASSAAAGLAALAEFRPQVIVSDIAMPDEDGLSFIRKVRRLDATQGGDVPAVALTALASKADRARSKQAGFQVHLAKPVDALRLASVVRQLANLDST